MSSGCQITQKWKGNVTEAIVLITLGRISLETLPDRSGRGCIDPCWWLVVGGIVLVILVKLSTKDCVDGFFDSVSLHWLLCSLRWMCLAGNLVSIRRCCVSSLFDMHACSPFVCVFAVKMQLFFFTSSATDRWYFFFEKYFLTNPEWRSWQVTHFLPVWDLFHSWHGHQIESSVRADFHLGGQTEFCPSGFSGGG